jgi:hypothetical protein
MPHGSILPTLRFLNFPVRDSAHCSYIFTIDLRPDVVFRVLLQTSPLVLATTEAATPFHSVACSLLKSLAPLFAKPILCFQ